MVPELVKRRVDGQLETFCLQHRHRMSCPQVTLSHAWEEEAVVLEARDGCNPAQPVARFAFSSELGQWSLFAPVQMGSWRLCLEIPSTLNFAKLLAYLEDDPLNLFWPPSFSCFS